MDLDRDDGALYNSRIFDTYLKLVRSRYKNVNIDNLMQLSNMELHQINDPLHWFTQEQADLFYDNLARMTANKNIAREAGRYYASPDMLGLFKQYIIGQLTPAKAYSMAKEIATKLTRSATFITKNVGNKVIEIEVIPRDKVTERPYQCENRLGSFEAVNLMFRNRLPRIDHPQCITKGDKTCRYIISWQDTPSSVAKKVRNYFAAASLAACGALLPFYAHEVLFLGIPFAFVVLAALSYIAIFRENFELNLALGNMQNSTEELFSRIEATSSNAMVISEIGIGISKLTEIGDIIENVMHAIKKHLDYDRGLILLANEDRTLLEYRAGYGHTDGQRRLLETASFHLQKNVESSGTFVKAFYEQKPILVNDIDSIAHTLSPRSLELAKKLGSKSFICCPIIFESKSLGVIVVDNVDTKRPLTQSDLNLVSAIAPELGVSIHNAALMQDRIAQFNSFLQALAATIDARDYLTAGHSERVTEYTVGICKYMGLSRDYTEMVRVASLLHDYGKIGIPDDILKKDGALTEDEYEQIKTHATKTKEILERVSFTGIYEEVPEIASSHHEKIDGSGYPRGLKGDEIPLGARIIAVADVFEAITAQRHYRNPMAYDIAMRIIREQSGVQLDARVVENFLKYLENEFVPQRAFDENGQYDAETRLAARSFRKTF